MPRCRYPLSKCEIFLTVSSILTMLLGICFVMGVDKVIFNAVLKSKLELYEGSFSYNIWKKTPVPMKLRFFLYEITNPYEFSKLGAKPIMKERGPYVYNEYHLKTNVTWENNSTVTFHQRRWWTFDPQASGNNSELDQITYLNSVPISAFHALEPCGAKNLSFFSQLVNDVTPDEAVIVNATAGDILFYGYQDDLLDMMHQPNENQDSWSDHLQTSWSKEPHNSWSHKPQTSSSDKPQTSWLDKPETSRSEEPETSESGNTCDLNALTIKLAMYDKMAWFYKRNESDWFDGLFNMYTGQDNINNFGILNRWNGTQDGGFYDEPCGHISGSQGELWPPGQDDTFISLYNTDLCSTLKLSYLEAVQSEQGLPAYRYGFTNTTFAYPHSHPSKKDGYCFCQDSLDANCPPAGLLDVQKCRMGAPAFVSLPHFLYAEPAAVTVGGVRPPQPSDLFYIDLIPELGVPVSVRARMQINIQTKQYSDVPGFAFPPLTTLGEALVPVVWFEVTADVPSDMADELRPVVWVLRHWWVVTVVWVLMIVGGVITTSLILYSADMRSRGLHPFRRSKKTFKPAKPKY